MQEKKKKKKKWDICPGPDRGWNEEAEPSLQPKNQSKRFSNFRIFSDLLTVFHDFFKSLSFGIFLQHEVCLIFRKFFLSLLTFRSFKFISGTFDSFIIRLAREIFFAASKDSFGNFFKIWEFFLSFENFLKASKRFLKTSHKCSKFVDFFKKVVRPPTKNFL